MPPARRDTRRGTSQGRLRHLEVVELVQFLEELVGALGLLRIHAAQREAHVDEHVVSEPGLGQMLETGLLDRATEVDASHPEPALLVDLDDLAGYGEAHQPFSCLERSRAATAAWPSARPPSFEGT